MSHDRIPVDSSDAREMREAAAELQAEELEQQRRHDVECRDGWRGQDEEGRPRPCLRCRPHLARRECRTCAAPAERCQAQRRQGRGACCGSCEHPGGSA